MDAKIQFDEKSDFAIQHESWVRKTALAAALGLGLLVSACGGGGESNPNEAAQLAKGEEQAAAGDEQLPADEEQLAAGEDEATANEDEYPDASIEDDGGLPDVELSAASEAQPQPAALLSATTAPLGVNLEGVSDWARLQPFVDLMKSARPWGTADAPWDEAAQVDARGWPTSDAAVVINVRSVEPGDESKPYRYITPGVYKLKFLGRATVSPIASPNVVVRNARYYAKTNTTTADVVIGRNASQLMLTFRNTSGGVRNVSLRMPGYTETATFTNEFKQALAPFKVVRFMDFLHTNNNPVSRWGQRTLPSSGSQASTKGAAYEYAILIANHLGKDMWINIPVNADDAYVRSLATLLKNKLKPGRVVYVEYSNELWNFVFSQATDNMNAAVNEAVAGDKTLTNGQACTREMFASSTGNCNSYWAGYYRVGKRTMRIAQIFKEVHGAAAINNRIRVVYPTQFANPDIAEQVLKNVATYRGRPSSLIYGIATAPYFYLAENVAASSSATTTQILASLDKSLSTENEPYFAAGVNVNGSFVRKAYNGGDYTGASHKALADFYGIKSLAYEGGPDLLQNPANRTAKIAANRSDKMGELVKREISQWFGCGNDLFMHFSLSSGWDQYGYWGLTNDPKDLTGPKYQAARAVAQSAKSAFTTCR